MLKWTTIILATLLILTNGLWLYGAIDLAVTEKYRQQEEYEKTHRIKELTKLNNHFVKGMSKSDLHTQLISLFPDFEPYEKEGYINTLWLNFKIGSDGKIETIE